MQGPRSNGMEKVCRRRLSPKAEAVPYCTVVSPITVDRAQILSEYEEMFYQVTPYCSQCS